MKYFNWNEEKNQELKAARNISFEEIIIAINEGNLLDDLIHPNKNKFPNQRIMIVNVRNYAFVVPYIEDKDEIFLKTIIPSRKMTKKYIGGR